MIKPTFEIEDELKIKGKKIILGIDEAGRGPLAGPLVCAGVIISNQDAFTNDIIRDSKTLSYRQRQEAFKIVQGHAEKILFSFVDNNFIDSHGMTNALIKGYREIIDEIGELDYILIDGKHSVINHKNLSMIVDGDKHSKSIAAASIVAKHLRDLYMIQSGKIFPEYEFHTHKGYGTKVHFKNIIKHGTCSLHRKTFLKKLD